MYIHGIGCTCVACEDVPNIRHSSNHLLEIITRILVSDIRWDTQLTTPGSSRSVASLFINLYFPLGGTTRIPQGSTNRLSFHHWSIGVSKFRLPKERKSQQLDSPMTTASSKWMTIATVQEITLIILETSNSSKTCKQSSIEILEYSRYWKLETLFVQNKLCLQNKPQVANWAPQFFCLVKISRHPHLPTVFSTQ